MAKYKAKMNHNQATITKLVQTQYDTFQFGKKILFYIIAMGMIFYGLYADSQMFTPWICLFLGCVMLSNASLSAKMTAKKIIKQMDGKFPKSEYTFDEKGFKFYKEGEEIPYSRLIRLIEDKRYMYLYVSEQSAYMVDKTTVSDNDVEGLKSHISYESDLKWTRPPTLLNFGLNTILENRRKKDHQGPRLK